MKKKVVQQYLYDSIRTETYGDAFAYKMKRRALAPAMYNARRLMEKPIPHQDLVENNVDDNQNGIPVEENHNEQDSTNNVGSEYEFSESIDVK